MACLVGIDFSVDPCFHPLLSCLRGVRIPEDPQELQMTAPICQPKSEGKHWFSSALERPGLKQQVLASSYCNAAVSRPL